VVQSARPDYVFHLAALINSNVLSDLLLVNVIGTQNVLEAVAATRPEARVLVTGSAAEYGLAQPGELPIREDNPLRPFSPYGVSKAAQSLLALHYTHCKRLDVVCTRTFNLIGPGEPPGLVGGDLARRIVEVEQAGPEGCICVGDLEAQRDFVDVRDALQAYWLAASQGVPGQVYNVCSGRPVRIAQVLACLIKCSTSRIEIQVDANLLVPQEVPISWGSSEKLTRATGWRPALSLEQSLQALLGACRGHRLVD
jgi:GDP-4-dehydro-6-deoxy-D-mannose reductase